MISDVAAYLEEYAKANRATMEPEDVSYLEAMAEAIGWLGEDALLGKRSAYGTFARITHQPISFFEGLEKQ